jgi:hypothetical protein
MRRLITIPTAALLAAVAATIAGVPGPPVEATDVRFRWKVDHL